jgi:hypothetical protein
LFLLSFLSVPIRDGAARLVVVVGGFAILFMDIFIVRFFCGEP